MFTWLIGRAAVWQVPAGMAMPWHNVSFAGEERPWKRSITADKTMEPRSFERSDHQDRQLVRKSTFEIVQHANDPASISEPPAQSFAGTLGGVGIEAGQGPSPASALVGERLSPSAPMLTADSMKSSLLLRLPADGWVFVRGGTHSNGAGVAGLPGYGGSQAGAVLRYALSDGKTIPTAYFRASGSLQSGNGNYREAAAGLSARPAPKMPVSLLTELRIQQSAGRTRMRPAIAAVTHIPPQILPRGFRAEIYGQGGYVAGRQGTPFFDGQVVVDRQIGNARRAGALRAGAGVWAGGQTGAIRLDLGPTVSAQLPAGRGMIKVSVDWRIRVAGNALPDSGLAATVAAGF